MTEIERKKLVHRHAFAVVAILDLIDSEMVSEVLEEVQRIQAMRAERRGEKARIDAEYANLDEHGPDVVLIGSYGPGSSNPPEVEEDIFAEIEDADGAKLRLVGLEDSAPKSSISHFGACPECGSEGEYLNISRNHWFFCKAHKVKWWAGSNLMSSWQYETPEQWAEYKKFLQDFTEVEPKY